MPPDPVPPPQLSYERLAGEGRSVMPIITLGVVSILCVPSALIVVTVGSAIAPHFTGLSNTSASRVGAAFGLATLLVGAITGYIGDRLATKTRHRMRYGILWLVTLAFYANGLLFILFATIGLVTLIA